MNIDKDLIAVQPATPQPIMPAVLAAAEAHTPNPEHARIGLDNLAQRAWDTHRAHYDNPTPWAELAEADREPWRAVAMQVMADVMGGLMNVAQRTPGAIPGAVPVVQLGNRRSRRAQAAEQRKRGR